MAILTSDQEHRHVLETARTVAVLGAHPDPDRPAHYVPRYLQGQGYRIVPVNPRYTDRELFGQAPHAKVSDLGEPIDVVDVFRNSRHLPRHRSEILAMRPLPKVVWFQQGVRDDEVARQLAEAGIDVVQDECMLALHKRFGIGRVDARDSGDRRDDPS